MTKAGKPQGLIWFSKVARLNHYADITKGYETVVNRKIREACFYSDTGVFHTL